MNWMKESGPLHHRLRLPMILFPQIAVPSRSFEGIQQSHDLLSMHPTRLISRFGKTIGTKYLEIVGRVAKSLFRSKTHLLAGMSMTILKWKLPSQRG
jgi:hypothetical protein